MAGGDADLIVGGSMNNVILQSSFDDRLKSDEGFLSTIGDLCTLTASAGKDLYITAGKIYVFPNAGGTALADEFVLKVNGTIKETIKTSWISTGGFFSQEYEFKNMFHKVTPKQILKIEVITLDIETDVEGFIQAIEVPTGENPLTYRGE